MKEKKIILKIDNVRVVESDQHNVVVEKLESCKLKSGETSEKWVFKGYYSTICSAVLAISRLELLLNFDDAKDVDSLIKRIMESDSRLIEAIDNMCSTCCCKGGISN
jgi:hypothetical protein